MKLYIPTNIPKERQVIEGLGSKELIQTVAVAGIGLLVGCLGMMLASKTISFLFFSTFIAGAAGLMVVKRNRYWQSIVIIFKAYMNFEKRQKRYRYQYSNIYEKEVRDSGQRQKTKQ